MSAQTLTAEGGGGPENLTSYTPRSMGFYRVVRRGISFFGMTNQSAFSNSVNLRLEAGYTNGSLASISVTPEGQTFLESAALTAPFPYPLALTVNTRLLSNGPVKLSSEGTYSPRAVPKDI